MALAWTFAGSGRTAEELEQAKLAGAARPARVLRLVAAGLVGFCGLGMFANVIMLFAMSRRRYWNNYWVLHVFWLFAFLAAAIVIGYVIRPSGKDPMAYKENVADQSGMNGSRIEVSAPDVGVSGLYKDETPVVVVAEVPSVQARESPMQQ